MYYGQIPTNCYGPWKINFDENGMRVYQRMDSWLMDRPLREGLYDLYTMDTVTVPEDIGFYGNACEQFYPINRF